MVDTRIGLYAAPVSLCLFLLHRYWHSIRQPKIRHPPSPSSLPLIGNLFSIPPGPEHFAFAKLGEQLNSDVVFLEILGHKLVILNSAEAASELLEKRSSYYSDRPLIPMVTDPALWVKIPTDDSPLTHLLRMNWPGLMSTMGYNDLWRHHRRIMNNWLNARAVTQFHDAQERQARLLLQQLLSVTDDAQLFKHVKDKFFFAMGSAMLQLAYGYKPRDPQDRIFKEARLAFHNVMSAAMQTNFFVNIFPVMLSIPEWFPGTGWKRIGREYGAQQDRAKTEPYEWLKAQVASGTYQLSLLGSLLPDHKLISGLSITERDNRLKEIGITLFGAAMVTNPHIQARAQQELDSVLGPAILPSISDKERLPYIKNLIDEVFRLCPVAPLAMPHACFQDDVYKGYDIQKGTAMAIGRDARHYKDPEVLNPDRYLDPNVPRPPVFGWGRRKCPGIHFAEAAVFINIASLLATFIFSGKRNSNGQEVIPQIEVERNSIMFELKPFDFEFKPRSDAHYQLIIGAVNE
ncbi:hypothetical protein FRC11_007133 [Ceratobasidium sp. 423]|nr:hypothetical protein FRC11_007133 [Ceratobasidium sp. 423]